jgi:transposase
LLEAVAAEEAVPEAAKQMLAFLGAQVAQLDGQIAELERQMKKQHKVSPVSQLLAEVPGIGPVSALSLALTIDPGRFQSGRHFAAWLGLVPKEHSTGGPSAPGRHQSSRQQEAAAVAGAGGNDSDPFRQAGARAPQPGY